MSQSEQHVSGRAPDHRVQELRASASLMTLEAGIFCLVNGSPRTAHDHMSGARVSAVDPADPNLTIVTFRSDGWISGGGDAALIRVLNGSAQIMITIYQPGGTTEPPPKLRVLRLSEQAPSAETALAGPAQGQPVRRPTMILNERFDVIAHVQRTGDVGQAFGEWVGTPGSRLAVEGFTIAVPKDLEPGDLSYQAVLGRGWLSPWVESGQFCGSRGMALPILGIKLKLSPAAAKRYDLSYAATFLDGTRLENLKSEESCETPSLAALEAMRITLAPKLASKKPAETAAAPKPTTSKGAPKGAAAAISKAPSPAKAPSKTPPKAAKPSKSRSR